jgi:hypothetical protein
LTLVVAIIEDTTRVEKLTKVYQALDEIAKKYGKHTIGHGSSLSSRVFVP